MTSTALPRLAQQRLASTRLKVGLAAASVSRMAEMTIRLVRMLARDTAMSATTIVPPKQGVVEIKWKYILKHVGI